MTISQAKFVKIGNAVTQNYVTRTIKSPVPGPKLVPDIFSNGKKMLIRFECHNSIPLTRRKWSKSIFSCKAIERYWCHLSKSLHCVKIRNLEEINNQPHEKMVRTEFECCSVFKPKQYNVENIWRHEVELFISDAYIYVPH